MSEKERLHGPRMGLRAIGRHPGSLEGKRLLPCPGKEPVVRRT